MIKATGKAPLRTRALQIQGQMGTVLMGIVVDAVSEVINIKADDIEQTPNFGTKLNTEYILGF